MLEGERELLLARRSELFRAILAETENQRDRIAATDVDGLSASLAARQAAMDAIDELDGRIGAGPSGQDAGIRLLLRRIAELDAENRKAAGEMALSLMSGFREVSAQRSMMAYTLGGAESKFIDREG